MAKKRSRRGASPRQLSKLSLESLQAELRRRQGAVKPLLRRRAALAARLAALDASLAALGAAGASSVASAAVRGADGRRKPGRRGPRAKNAVGLVDMLRKAMAGKQLGIDEAAKAVLAAGYKTNSKKFRTVVNQTLLANKSSFRKVARGTYTAR